MSTFMVGAIMFCGGIYLGYLFGLSMVIPEKARRK